MQKNIKWRCRVAPSLGALEGTPNEVWGTLPYGDLSDPSVFFGLYGLPDFYTLWRHKGPKFILWAGSDIRHFVNGYWLDAIGEIQINPRPFAAWIDQFCYSWCENEVEQKALENAGIHAKVCPSFLGNVNNFPVSKKKTDKKMYYSSVSGNDFKLYGWAKINEIAERNPDIEYHLYGNTIEWEAPKNVIVHGRVPKETMNGEIKSMTGAIRLVDFDGCSELVVKAVLMGQEVISTIDYPFLHAKNPREELLKTLNKFPWNTKI